jgi:phospholipid/cholesterol/gamma-HCH transport system substrate-binding protein
VDAGEAAPTIDTLLARADRAVADAQRTLDAVHRVASDEALLTDARETLASARRIAKTIDEDAGPLISRAGEAVSSVGALTNRYAAVAEDVSRALVTIQRILEKAESGEGTVGLLLSDAALYRNLTDASRRLGLALTEVRLLVEKWKSEGLPIQF